MAKLSYILSKSTKRAGKSGFHFDGSGSGNYFQKIFRKDREEVLTPASEIRDLVSKLVTEFDGNSETHFETRIELEGSTEELKEFAGWSIGYIKANGEFLKDVGAFIKSYFDTLTEECIKIIDKFKAIEEKAAAIKKASEKKEEKKSDK